jgi:hypothetical protein
MDQRKRMNTLNGSPDRMNPGPWGPNRLASGNCQQRANPFPATKKSIGHRLVQDPVPTTCDYLRLSTVNFLTKEALDLTPCTLRPGRKLHRLVLYLRNQAGTIDHGLLIGLDQLDLGLDLVQDSLGMPQERRAPVKGRKGLRQGQITAL